MSEYVNIKEKLVKIIFDSGMRGYFFMLILIKNSKWLKNAYL